MSLFFSQITQDLVKGQLVSVQVNNLMQGVVMLVKVCLAISLKETHYFLDMEPPHFILDEKSPTDHLPLTTDH